MKILAISGSARRSSTNTALLRALRAIAPDNMAINVFQGIGDLPVFSPDREGENLPDSVEAFMRLVSQSDGLLISSPEYVRSIPGGLKNAIDWLVSGDQIVGKPIALVHASHRGDDMLSSLRTVLSTVSSNFNRDLFFRLSVMKETPDSILDIVKAAANRLQAEQFLSDFAFFCQNHGNSGPSSILL